MKQVQVLSPSTITIVIVLDLVLELHVDYWYFGYKLLVLELSTIRCGAIPAMKLKLD